MNIRSGIHAKLGVKLKNEGSDDVALAPLRLHRSQSGLGGCGPIGQAAPYRERTLSVIVRLRSIVRLVDGWVILGAALNQPRPIPR